MNYTPGMDVDDYWKQICKANRNLMDKAIYESLMHGVGTCPVTLPLGVAAPASPLLYQDTEPAPLPLPCPTVLLRWYAQTILVLKECARSAELARE